MREYISDQTLLSEDWSRLKFEILSFSQMTWDKQANLYLTTIAFLSQFLFSWRENN